MTTKPARITLPTSLSTAHAMILGRDNRINDMNAAAVKLQMENARLMAEREELRKALQSIIIGEFGHFDPDKIAAIAAGTYWDRAAKLIVRLKD